MENNSTGFKKLKCVHCGKTLCMAYPVNGGDFEVSGEHDFKKDGAALEIKCVRRNSCGKINYIKRLENDKTREYHPGKESINAV